MKNKTLLSELIIEIISLLPVKDLLRFNCVSKSWLSLISSDSYLSRLQLDRVALSALPLLILQTVHYLKDNDGANYPNFSNYCFTMGFSEIRNPFRHGNDVPCGDAEVVASCDGILVLRQVKTHSLALLNPSTGKYHLVPSNPAGNLNVVFSGFGFDCGKKCYKLVTIIKPSETDHFLALMIYCVNETWRKVESKVRFDDVGRLFESYECSFNRPGLFAYNNLFWHFKYPEYLKGKIVCFSLEDEEFFKTRDPDFGYILCECVDMVLFDECLCLVCTWGEDNLWWIPEGDENDRTDIWVMNENSWQWTKVLSISNVKTRLDSSDDLPYIQIIPVCYYSAGGYKVLFMMYEEAHFPEIDEDEGTLALYDVDTGRFEKLREPGDETSLKVITCKRSLVGNGMF